MKHMKKVVAILLVAVMTLCFASCDTAEVIDFVVENFLTPNVAPSYIDGDTYINNEMGFYFDKPARWTYYSDEEIAETMNAAVAEYFGEYAELILSIVNPSTYDMMAVDGYSGCNVMVGYENLARTFQFDMTEEEYLLKMKSNLDMVSSGMTVYFPEEFEQVKLGDVEFTRAICDTYASGIHMTQVYYAHKGDGYMGFVIITLRGATTLAEIESCFRS